MKIRLLVVALCALFMIGPASAASLSDSFNSSSSTSFETSMGFSMNSSIAGALSSQNSAEVATTKVPVPAAAWLFMSGLVGLIGISRRKKTHHHSQPSDLARHG